MTYKFSSKNSFFLKKMFDIQKSPVYKAALCSAEVLEKANKTKALTQK